MLPFSYLKGEGREVSLEIAKSHFRYFLPLLKHEDLNPSLKTVPHNTAQNI